MQKAYRCVILGDQSVGKTSFIISKTQNTFPAEYVPSILEPRNFSYTPTGSTEAIDLVLLDTQLDHEQSSFHYNNSVNSKSHKYPSSPKNQKDFDTEKETPIDFYIMLFSVMNPSSFENVKLKWAEIIRKEKEKTNLNSENEEVNENEINSSKIVLVGTKADLRENATEIERLREKKVGPIIERRGNQMAKEIGAERYMECSSLTGRGVREVFEEVGRLIQQETERRVTLQRERERQKRKTWIKRVSFWKKVIRPRSE